MKKFLSLLLVMLLCLSFAACGGEGDEAESSSETQSDMSSQPTESDPAYEPSYSKKANLEKLKEIEEADDFEIEIASVECIPGALRDGNTVSLDGDDAVVVTVKNNTDATVNELYVLILCTDKNGNGCSLGVLQGFTAPLIIDGKVVRYSDEVKCMGSETANLGAGESKEFAIRCSLANIENVNIIAYSYTDSKGSEIINKNHEEWLKNTLEYNIQ